MGKMMWKAEARKTSGWGICGRPAVGLPVCRRPTAQDVAYLLRALSSIGSVSYEGRGLGGRLRSDEKVAHIALLDAEGRP